MTGDITAKYYHDSRTVLVRDVQCQIEDSPNFTRMQRSLNLFNVDEGVLQCPGCSGNAPLRYQARFPILLTKDSHISQLITHQAH